MNVVTYFIKIEDFRFSQKHHKCSFQTFSSIFSECSSQTGLSEEKHGLFKSHRKLNLQYLSFEWGSFLRKLDVYRFIGLDKKN